MDTSSSNASLIREVSLHVSSKALQYTIAYYIHVHSKLLYTIAYYIHVHSKLLYTTVYYMYKYIVNYCILQSTTCTCT